MEQSPRLSLSYVAPNQAQKHVTVNESFRRLDALAQAVVLSRTVTAEPASPAEGDAYIIPSGASGAAWSAYNAGDLAAFQDGAWTQIAPFEGLRLWVSDGDEFMIHDGTQWVELSGGGGGGSSETAAKFGVNTTADTTNKLSVKSDAVLFSHDDVTPGAGDAQVKVNKAAAGDTASHLFQTNFSSRAEFGLTGDDDFHVKVSSDGSSWIEAMFIDKQTGYVGFGTTSPATPFHVNAGPANVAFKLEGTDPTVVFQMQDDTTMATGNGPILFLRTGDNIQFYTAGAGRMTVTPTGNVGIGVSSPSARLQVYGGGLVVGAPTGGDKGSGALNAESVYDDNTLLSCYVFDQALDGSLDVAKWDAKTPDKHIPEQRDLDPQTGDYVLTAPAETVSRRHEPMRKFASRIGTPEDPLTLDGYAKHWKEKRHLTAMPNEADFDPVHGQLTTGEWIQRLVETVEIQAVLIEALNARLKTLEAAPGRR